MSRFKTFLSRLVSYTPVRTKEVCVDLDSLTTKVLVEEQIIFNQVSCVVFHKDSNEIISIGDKAFSLLGKVPAGLEVSFPFADDAVVDGRSFRLYAKTLLKKVRDFYKEQRMTQFTIKIGVPGATKVTHQKFIEESFQRLGVGRVTIVPRAGAAWKNLSKTRQTSKTCCLVLFGGSSSDLVLISEGKYIDGVSTSVGYQDFIKTIIRIVRLQHHVLISRTTAAKVCAEIGKIYLPTTEDKQSLHITVTGKNVLSQLPATVTISSLEFEEEFCNQIDKIVQQLIRLFSSTSPELVETVLKQGIIISGMNVIDGVGEYISQKISCPVVVSRTANQDVIQGLQ